MSSGKAAHRILTAQKSGAQSLTEDILQDFLQKKIVHILPDNDGKQELYLQSYIT